MGFIQKIEDLVALFLCWTIGLFPRAEPLPRITQFRWTYSDFPDAEAVLSFGDGDVRNVYCDDGRWYYYGGISIDSERLVNLLADLLLEERRARAKRQEAGL
jgi:hypothetical protein